MSSLAALFLKRFYAGSGYYSTGTKRVGENGKEDVAYYPTMSPPTEALVEKHFLGQITLGAYTLRQDNTVMWVCFDIDSNDQQKARDMTLKISNMLASIPHAIEYSGRKGYHVWVFFRAAIPAKQVKELAEEIRKGAGGKLSGDTHVEIFPKQAELTETNPLGNLVKLPLGLHPVTGNKSKFIHPERNWEKGDHLDPELLLSKTCTLEEFAQCAGDYEDPIDIIVDTLGPLWVDGERHDLALYLSGWLATTGWDEEDALTVVERLCEVGGGDLKNQLQAVEDTYRKFKSGGQVLGLQAISEKVPGTVLRRLADAISKQKITPIMTLIDKIRLEKGVTYLKSRSAAKAVIAFLNEKGKVLIDIASDSLYWLDKTSHHLYSMEDSWWDTVLYNTFGLNTAESFGSSTAKGVYHIARENASKVNTYSRSHWDGNNLWMNLGSSYNYILSGEEGKDQGLWGRKVLNGEEDVIFRTRSNNLHLDLDQSWEKGVRPLDPWKYLVNDLNFGIGSSGVNPAQQKELIKAWFLSTFFPNVMPTRPLLTIIADPGAGKTTAARRFLQILEGPGSEVNGVVNDKPDSLRATIAAHKFVVLDNLEKNKSVWLVDMLNRISTGTHIELRKLHTTNEMQRILPDCFIIITATSLPFAEESLFTRLLPVELATLKNPIPEYAMQRAISDNIDGIWMGIMGMLNITVRELRRVRTAAAPTESRLADFTVFCSRIRGLENGTSGGILDGDNLIRGLEMMTNRQKLLLNESSPMVGVIDVWLKEDREQAVRPGSSGKLSDKWHSASELNSIWQKLAMRMHIQWIWESGHSLSKHIQALENHLMRNYGMETLPATNNSPKKYRFKPAEIDFTGLEMKDYQPDNGITIDLERD